MLTWCIKWGRKVGANLASRRGRGCRGAADARGPALAGPDNMSFARRFNDVGLPRICLHFVGWGVKWGAANHPCRLFRLDSGGVLRRLLSLESVLFVRYLEGLYHFVLLWAWWRITYVSVLMFLVCKKDEKKYLISFSSRLDFKCGVVLKFSLIRTCKLTYVQFHGWAYYLNSIMHKKHSRQCRTLSYRMIFW